MQTTQPKRNKKTTKTPDQREEQGSISRYPVGYLLDSRWDHYLSFLLSQKGFLSNAIAYALVLRQTLKTRNKTISVHRHHPVQLITMLSAWLIEEGQTCFCMYHPRPGAMHKFCSRVACFPKSTLNLVARQ
jgi:hypothetical protein